MSEIERAIKVLEEEYAFALECDDTQKRSSALHAALAVLRAELEREKNPLTCDGCKRLPHKYEGSIMCQDCSRGTILPDRYEPKGEPNV